MGWQDLLGPGEEETILPWAGGPKVYLRGRSWKIQGRRPRQHGWHVWKLSARTAEHVGVGDGPDPDFEEGHDTLTGYLAGSRFISDQARVDLDPTRVVDQTEQVYCTPRGLDRFTRAVAVRIGDRKLIFLRQEFPQGPELEVQAAYQDRLLSVGHIRDVSPALDLTFRWEVHQRELEEEAERERQRLAAEEEARLEREERMREAMRNAGTGAGRRVLAQRDFKAAARAALALSGAELLDVLDGVGQNEKVVQYRFRDRRLECVCDKHTLRILDAGVCLDDHRGTKGDTYFTLESLPGVIGQAIDERRLVVWRHVPGDPGYDDYDDRW